MSTPKDRTPSTQPPTAEETAGLLRELVSHLRQNRTQLREEWARRITRAQLLTAMTEEEIFAEATSVYDNYVEALETGTFEALQAYARNLSERIIPRGVETHEVVGIVLLPATCWPAHCSGSTTKTSTSSTASLMPTSPQPTASPTRWRSGSCRSASASSGSSRKRSGSCPPRCSRYASASSFSRSSASSIRNGRGSSPSSCCARFAPTAPRSS